MTLKSKKAMKSAGVKRSSKPGPKGLAARFRNAAAATSNLIAQGMPVNAAQKLAIDEQFPPKRVVRSGMQPKRVGAVQHAARSYIAATAKSHSESYAVSLARPIGAFVDWCIQYGVASIQSIDTKTLEVYRRHAERVGKGRALSTLRMALARVQTFLRVSGCKADLKVLRLQHTKAEKRRLAELAAEREAAA